MHPAPRSPDRRLRRPVGLFLVSLVVLVGGCSTAGASASPTSTAGAGAGAGPAGPASGAIVGAPAQAPGPVANGVGASSGGGVGGSGSASIAYPYPVYPGAPGIAPDHTIVVVGTGEAAVKADRSERASARRSALAAALADAKAQADVVARAAGVTITGVLSVSVSSGESYYAIPMVTGSAGSAPGATQGGPTTEVPPAVMPVDPGLAQLTVSVTVAYRIG
jgi:hypothetical protein